MEALSTTQSTTQSPASVPAPEVANVTYQVPASTPQMEVNSAMESITKPKMNYKDIILSGTLFAMTIMVIVYTRLAMKKLEEQPSLDDFDNLNNKINEVEYNLKKVLGKRYEKI